MEDLAGHGLEKSGIDSSRDDLLSSVCIVFCIVPTDIIMTWHCMVAP